MVDLIRSLEPARVRENLERVRQDIAQAGRDPAAVQLLVAVKYLPAELLGVLAEAGVRLLGENRAGDLITKSQAYPGVFSWDFIGALQSRKVRELLPHVRLIHSVASESALRELARHATPQTRVLVEVNVARERGKAGIDPNQLEGFVSRCPVTVAGLMTMPPQVKDPEQSRPHFAALARLARDLGLAELSMGTSQDYRVAVQEGATIIRLGSTLLRAADANSPQAPGNAS